MWLCVCRAASAATAAMSSPLRLAEASEASSLLVLITAPQDSTVTEVGLRCLLASSAVDLHGYHGPVLFVVPAGLHACQYLYLYECSLP